MAKTVVAAPRKPAAPPAPIAEADAIPLQPASTPEPTLDEWQAIEQRLSDGLAGIEGQQAQHRAALERIAAELAALPGKIEEAQARLAALQQEQSLLPRRINSARAVLVGAMGTPAESQAREQLDALQARQQTLPHALADTEGVLQDTRAACLADQAQREQERAEHQAALAGLASFAQALREEASQAHRQVAEAIYASIEAEQRQRQAALEEAEKATAEARAALATLAEDAKARLQQTAPDLLLRFQAAYLPVRDGVTERLEMARDYRAAMLRWQTQGNLWLGQPYYWFQVNDAERSYPNIQQQTIEEIERALSKHIAEQQQRLR